MRKKARYGVFALALGVCALAIPATASADGYSSANAITGDSSDSTQPSGGAAGAAANAHRTPTELAQTTAAGEPSGSGGSPQVDAGSTSPNALSGAHEPSTAEPTFVSDSTGTSSEGFDWASAGLGAGAATLVALALVGAALLTIRRRTAVSPSG